MSPKMTAIVAGAACACVLSTGAASALQTSSRTETRKFEVIAVDGNRLVVREAAGTKEYTVPATFRFTVDGRDLSVGELKPGMMGTATITTTTTVTPVTVTEVREATVMQVAGNSVIVRGSAGIQMFSPGEIAKRNIRIIRDGRTVDLSALRAGDRLTATIVTEHPPKVLTERDVKATLDAASVTAATTPPAADPPAAATPPAAAPPAAATPAEPATAPEVASGTGGGFLWAAIGLAAIAVVMFLVSRRRTRV